MDDSYESVLLIVRECYVYRIPARATSKGYKASDWDVNNFLWKGRCRISAQKGVATIYLEDGSSGALFAKCTYDPDKNTVEPVLDSSRYFVLRIEDANSGKHAYIGLGFLERAEAFDFNVALQDFVKQTKAEKAAAEGVPSASAGPKIDYSLKAGEQISINIGNMSKRPNKTRSNEDLAANAPLPFLAPPPTAAAAKSQMKQSAEGTGVGVFGATTDQFGRQITSPTAAGSKSPGLSPASKPNGGSEWSDFSGFADAKSSRCHS